MPPYGQFITNEELNMIKIDQSDNNYFFDEFNNLRILGNILNDESALKKLCDSFFDQIKQFEFFNWDPM